MAVEIPEGDDTEMNMTPMIDIVFQLIIFFLLSLKNAPFLVPWSTRRYH